MAELEDVTLDGKPLHSLRVADLKLALEHRNLPKSGQKNALIKRLKGALMLENLQRTSTPHIGLQPNSQIGEEMSQNSFIKQYLAKQQELLRQRLEREAREAVEAEESPTEEEQAEDNDGASYLPDMHRPMPSQPPLTRAEEEGGGLPMGLGLGMMGRRPDFSSGSAPQESSDTPGGRIHRPALHLGHEEPATPSPPRAVASLSVRVLGQPERLGLPPSMPRPHEREGVAPAEPGSAHPVLHQSRSARAAVGRVQEDSDDEDDDEDDDDSDVIDYDEWGPASGARRGAGGGRPPPQPQQPSPSVPLASRERSRRKLQPPQHIPPQQVHQPPMQLRQPTPPPSPPPELSFPLPDTPKQSPPDMEEPEGAGDPGVAAAPLARPPPGLQRQDSDSSSRSSSPEPPPQRRPGPLSLLVRKMESERASGAEGRKKGEATKDGSAAAGPGEASLPGPAVGGAGPPGVVMFPGGAVARGGSSSTGHIVPVSEAPAPLDMSGSQPRSAAVPAVAEPQSQATGDREGPHAMPWKRSQDLASLVPSTAESEEPPVDLSAAPPQPSKKSLFLRDTPHPLPSSPPGSATTSPPASAKRPRMFSDTHTGSMVSPPSKAPRQGVFISEPQHASKEVVAAVKAAAEKPEGNDVEMKQAKEETPKMEVAKKGPLEFRDAEVKSQLEPMGPVLPPAILSSREAGGKGERGRQGKERGKTSSGSSDSSSSDSDSRSSSSHSSGSSSSREKPRSIRQNKKAGLGKMDDRKQDKGEKKPPFWEVKSQPSGASGMEVDADSASSPAQPAPEPDPDHSEGCLEESSTPKAFAARKISLTTGSKASEGAAGEAESGGAAGRKRRWGSSTSVTTKKPSISITTDSLKSLIPDIKANQEAVVDLHPEELQLSGEEEGEAEEEEEEGEEVDPATRHGREDQGLDKGLKIRRTVTQVVPGEGQENGQKEEEEEKPDKEKGRKDGERTRRDRRKSSTSEDAVTVKMETTPHDDAEAKKVTPSDGLVRRSISQQKSGVSVTIDDPVRTARQPSPPRGKVSCIVHVTNLVRPFTLNQLKELLNRTGTLLEEGFWIDKIKSHCYVTYASTEEAVATREALHGVKWPLSNPKVLSVDFCEQDELDFHRGLLKRALVKLEHPAPPGAPPARPAAALPPLMAERGAPCGAVRDQWAEREREMARRERTRAEREWDRHKIQDFGRPGDDARRSHSRERRRRERAKSRERKTDVKKEKADEPPAKLLDDLFRKTKTAPCIYWLPLTEEQAVQRSRELAERQQRRVRRRKEQQEEEDKRMAEEQKERIKNQSKAGGATSAAATAGWAGAGRGAEGDKEKERDRGREREEDRRRDGYRPRGPSGGPRAGRRSRSRSNPRDRRR